MLLEDTIRLFLDSVGRSDEYEFYLKKFRSEPSRAFAVLVPDLESLETAASALSFQLKFLRRLELVPLQVYSGPLANRMLSAYRNGGDDPVAVDCSLDEIAVKGAEVLLDARTRDRSAVLLLPDAPLVAVLRALSDTFTRRFHFIRMRGPLHDVESRPLSYYHLRGENPEISERDGSLLDAAAACAEAQGRHVSVSTPINLLREIFTVKGAGTIFRKGSLIAYAASSAEVDRARMSGLLEKSFGRPLRRADFLETIQHFHYEKDYAGAVLLEDRPEGAYLSKFAVGTEARGEGIAQELWEAVRVRHPALFWRSRSGSSVNRWYARISDGSHKVPGWQIFWKGVNPAQIPAVIDFCVKKEEDFVPRSAN